MAPKRESPRSNRGLAVPPSQALNHARSFFSRAGPLKLFGGFLTVVALILFLQQLTIALIRIAIPRSPALSADGSDSTSATDLPWPSDAALSWNSRRWLASRPGFKSRAAHFHLDERPLADWALSAKAVTVSILGLPHSPLMNRRRTAKIAFLFLVDGQDVLHKQLWSRFLQGNDGKYSLYVHVSNPAAVAAKKAPDNRKRSAADANLFAAAAQYIPSLPVSQQKRDMSAVDAQRRLLARALLDTDNHFFLLLSEDTVPVHNFTFVYAYLLSSRQSFVEVREAGGVQVEDDIDEGKVRENEEKKRKKDGGVNPKKAGAEERSSSSPLDAGDGGPYRRGMAPLVPEERFVVGSEHMALNRAHATAVVADTLFYNVFRRHCAAHGGDAGREGAASAAPGGVAMQELKSFHGKWAGGRQTASTAATAKQQQQQQQQQETEGKNACVPSRHFIHTFINIVDEGGNAGRSLTFDAAEDLNSTLSQYRPDQQQQQRRRKQQQRQKQRRGRGQGKADIPDVDENPVGLDAAEKMLNTIRQQTGIMRSPYDPEVPCVVNGNVRNNCFLFAGPLTQQAEAGLLALSSQQLGY